MQGGVPSSGSNNNIIDTGDDLAPKEEETKKPKYILEDVLDYNQRKG